MIWHLARIYEKFKNSNLELHQTHTHTLTYHMRWGGRGEHDQKNSRFPPPPKMNNVQILQLKKREFDSSSTIILIFIQNSPFFQKLENFG